MMFRSSATSADSLDGEQVSIDESSNPSAVDGAGSEPASRRASANGLAAASNGSAASARSSQAMTSATGASSRRVTVADDRQTILRQAAAHTQTDADDDRDTALSRAAGCDFDQLLADLRRGVDSQWTVVWAQLQPVVLGYLRGQRAPNPEDLTGEIFFHVVRDLHQFAGTETQFRSWVFTIAHHRLIDARRKISRRPFDPTEDGKLERAAEGAHATGTSTLHDDNTDVAEVATDAVRTDDVLALLEPLTPDQRQALLLRIVGGLTLSEIAEVMGKRPGAVKQLQRRGIVAMRERMSTEALDLTESPAYPRDPLRALSEVTNSAASPDSSAATPHPNRHRPGLRANNNSGAAHEQPHMQTEPNREQSQ